MGRGRKKEGGGGGVNGPLLQLTGINGRLMSLSPCRQARSRQVVKLA